MPRLSKGVSISRLCKFRSFATDQQISFAEDILLNHRLYVPLRSELNDPFDCACDISVNATDSEKLNRTIQRIKLENPGISDARARDIAPSKLADFIAQGPRLIREFIDSIGIISFSERADQQLLWSHYASAHTGICIEFAPNNDTRAKFFGQTLLVRYDKERVVPNFFTDEKEEIVRASLLAKSTDWEYEAERRILIPNRGSEKFLSFHPDLVSRVYLGCRIRTEHRALVIEWLTKRRSATRPNLYEAVASTSQYLLSFRPVVT